MTTVYAMLHHDRHTDPEIKVFHSKDAAVEYAREKAKDCCGYPEDYVEEQIADGHIDGLACFARPGLVLLETLTDPACERAKVLRENRTALQGATDARGRTLEVIEIEDAWRAEKLADTFCISYINFYLANGGVVMPSYDAPGDGPARRIIEKAFPSRSVVQVDVRDIAIGGGGIHCITQQQPT